MRRRKKRIGDRYRIPDVGDAPAKEARTVSDPHEMALAITLVDILGEAVNSAGAVRDLVHQHITEDRRAVKMTQKIYETAMDQVPSAPRDVRGAFLDAFQAAWAMPAPGAKAAQKIILEELDTSSKLIVRNGICQAAAEAYAGAFPAGAQTAVHTRGQLPYQNSAKFPHTRNTFFTHKARQMYWRSVPDVMALAWIYQKTHKMCMSGTDMDDIEGEAFERACDAALSRIAKKAATPDPTYALCMAATAVMLQAISEHGIRKYVRRHAKNDCAQIAEAISEVSGLPLERAEIIPNAILEGARMYLNDTKEAMGEAAVRAIRVAHMWVSIRAATIVFQGTYGLAVGAVWAASPDRGRFELIYERALDMAGRMDPDIQYAFNPLTDLSDIMSDDMHAATWDFFYDASGRTLAQWAKVAQGTDYKSVALLPENGSIMEVYRSYYDKSVPAAISAAANEKRSER